MNSRQLGNLRAEFMRLAPTLLAHGACRGADDEADGLAAEMGIHRVAYPSTASTRVYDNYLQARVGSQITIVLPPQPPLVRDKIIVDIAEILIAAPKSMTEILRSGTWTTVRYARRQKKQIIMLWPEEAR
jgi:hypothetical protein